MEKKTMQAINIALIIFITAFVIIELRWLGSQAAKPPVLPKKEKAVKEEAGGYTVVSEEEERGPKSDFEKMFVENPKEDVGGNVVKAWRGVPEETAQGVSDDLDKNIKELEEKLSRNPDDKKAKHKLKITKLMKKLVENGFDISKGAGN